MLYGKNVFVHTTYGKFPIYCMEKLSIFHIDKDVPDDTEQVHNKYIDMTHLAHRQKN